MIDAEQLLQAVAAAPEDDLPRLIAADWYEEHGDADYATFLRNQVYLAQCKPWDPLAVQAQHRHPEWLTGETYRDRLPELPCWGIDWHPERPFIRGLPGSLVVQDLNQFLEEADRLFDHWPIVELHLPTATLEQWRRFGRGRWLPRVQRISFYGTITPIEPMRVLADSPLATGLHSLHFQVASRPGMPEMLRALTNSPRIRQLRHLALDVGPHQSRDLLDALFEIPVQQLQLRTITIDLMPMRGYPGSPLAESLRSLRLTNVRMAVGLLHLGDHAAPRSHPLQEFRSSNDSYWFVAAQQLIHDHRRLPELAAIEFDQVSEQPHPLESDLFGLTPWEKLRSFRLTRSRLWNTWRLESLTTSRCWKNLVELDLRQNRFDDEQVRHLLVAPHQPNLTILRLDGNPISLEMMRKLRDRFGEKIILDDENEAESASWRMPTRLA